MTKKNFNENFTEEDKLKMIFFPIHTCTIIAHCTS